MRGEKMNGVWVAVLSRQSRYRRALLREFIGPDECESSAKLAWTAQVFPFANYTFTDRNASAARSGLSVLI